MKIADLVSLGILPFQHHYKDELEDIEERYTPRAIRIEASGRGEDFKPQVQDDSASDILGGVLWRVQGTERNGLHTLGFAFPAVTTRASKLAPIPPKLTGTRTRAQQDANNAARAAAIDARNKPRPVFVRPVKNKDYEADERYREIEATMPKGVENLPAGHPVIILPTMEEDKQTELALPVGGTPLIAVNKAGDPDTGSLVSDLNDKDEIDIDWRAHLQTAFRIVRPNKGVALPQPGPTVALNFTGTGQRNKPGYGMIVGRPTEGAIAYTVITPLDLARAADEQLDRPSPEEIAASNAAGETFISGGVTTWAELNARLTQQYNQLNSSLTQEDDDPFDTGPTLQSKTRTPKTTQSILDGTNPTKTRTPTTQQPPPNPKPNPSPTGLVLAAMSTEMGGPIDVGDMACQHRLALSVDGEAVNSAHISTDALFRQNSARDAALEFQAIPYSNPPVGVWPMRTHIRYNGGATHNHPTGSKNGRWMLETDGFFFPDDEPPPPKKKTSYRVHDLSGGGLYGGGAAGGGGGGGGPGPKTRKPGRRALTAGIDREAFFLKPGVLLEEEAFRLGLDAEREARRNAGDPEQNPRNGQGMPDGQRAPYPSSLSCVGFFGSLLRPPPWQTGEIDYSRLNNPTQEDVDNSRRIPYTSTTLGFAAGDGSVNGWTYNTKPQNGLPTADGGEMLIPAGVMPGEVFNPPAAGYNVHSVTRVYPTGLSSASYGTVDISTGKIKSGSRVESVGGTYTTTVVDSAGADTSVVMGISETAYSMAGAPITNMEGVSFVEQSADPFTGSQVGLYAGDTAGTNEAWWRRDDGTKVDLSTGVGGTAKFIDGLVVRYSDADSFTVSPGTARDDANTANMTLSAETTADITTKHSGSDGLATLNGLDEKGLDNLSSGSITCSQTGTTITATGDVTTHYGTRAITGDITAVGTSVAGEGTKFTEELRIGDLIGSSTTYGWSRISAIASDNSATLVAAFPGGNPTSASGFTIIHNATIQPAAGTVDRVSTINAAGTSIVVPTSASHSASSALTIGGSPGSGVVTLWMYLWLVSNGTTPGLLWSTQHEDLLAPPSGYTQCRRIAAVPYGDFEGGTAEFFEVYGEDGGVKRKFRRTRNREAPSTEKDLFNQTSINTWTTFSVPFAFPRTGTQMGRYVLRQTAGATAGTYTTHAVVTGEPQITTIERLRGTASETDTSEVWLPHDGAGNIDVRGTTPGGSTIAIAGRNIGWEDVLC